ncbi:NACHT domain-containing protein [Streptomyces sp. RGM 3693]|uniref:NACHT domain-containing protein n=1 Tax=Streptomyces sp. RGM 3693 TaxID=3413284 RepID=UPI003D2A63BC
MWRESRTDKVRQRLLNKLLPRLLSEEELWSGDDGLEFPVPVRHGVRYVAHPRREVATLPDALNGREISGADAAQAFDSSLGRLLIIGEPGAGKTYILRRIMRHSIAKAQEKTHEPIPFYLHLSAWPGSRQETRDWVIELLSRQYGVHEQHLNHWFTDGELSLFIDGLDELDIRRRRECIIALNKFLSQYPNLEVVITCRKREYEDTKKLLQLRGSIDVRPIETKSLAYSLDSLGADFAQLQEAIRASRRLRSLLQNPLFLRLALITYREADKIRLLESRNMEASLLQEYVEHCEQRAGLAHNESIDTAWLARIAQALRSRKLVSFFPDRAPVEYFPVELERNLARAAFWSCFLAVVIPTILVRLVMTALAVDSNIQTVYFALTWITPLSFGFLAGKMAKTEIRLAPVARTTEARRSVTTFLRQTATLFLAQGAVAFLLQPFASNPVIGPLVVLGFPISMMVPPMRMIRSSKRAEKSRMPFHPGEELASVRRSAIIVGLLVGGGFYASASLSMYALYPALKNALLFQPGINTIFFAVPIGLLAALRNGGADLIRRYLCIAIMIRNDLLPRRYFKTLESLRRSSILVPRLGSFEFRHLLVRDHLAMKAKRDLAMRRNIPLADG